MVRIITSQGKYTALYINIESAQAAGENVEKALNAIIGTLQFSIQEHLGDEQPTIEFLEEILKHPEIY